MSAPKPYDLLDPEEYKRLIREVLGYMKVSRNDGTDLTGRAYAIEALEKMNISLNPPNKG